MRTVASHVRWSTIAIVGLVLGALSVLSFGVSAHAEPPLRVNSHIVDMTSDKVLSSSMVRIDQAIDRLADRTRLDLYVVFVDDFDGENAEEWAAETATISQLGREDILLAVAVEERAYAISVDDSISLTDSQLESVAYDQVEPMLAANRWGDAAVAAADGYLAASGGSTGNSTGDSPGSTSGSRGSGFGTGLLITLVILAVIVVVVVILLKRRGKSRSAVQGSAQPTGLPALETAELERRASAALVEVDDDLRTFTQELGFARAQFGDEATATFAQELEAAQQKASRAFALRQQLDDATAETEPQKRDMLIEIVTLCDQIDESLGAQVASFDELRDEQNRVGETLESLERAASSRTDAIAAARDELSALRARYPESALASVGDNPNQAEQILRAVQVAVGEGKDAAAAGDAAAAVSRARIAQNSLGHIDTLLSAVHDANAALAAASERLTAAITSISADIADAERLAPADASVSALVTEGQAAITQAQTALSPGSTADPLAALNRIAAAEQGLDASLASRREQEEVDRRARALLGDAIGRTESTILAANNFIETRRGAVGSEARTRLNEATRLLGEARTLAAGDPRVALETAQKAASMATSASSMAQADVSRWDAQQARASYQQSSGGLFSSDDRGVDLGSMLLGGLLFGDGGGSYRGSSYRRSSSSGRSRSSFGGSSRRSSGGSFGGSRGGRRGGGGRF